MLLTVVKINSEHTFTPFLVKTLRGTTERPKYKNI